jgi:hypothetical protein
MGKTMVVSDHQAVFFPRLGGQKKGNANPTKDLFWKKWLNADKEFQHVTKTYQESFFFLISSITCG